MDNVNLEIMSQWSVQVLTAVDVVETPEEWEVSRQVLLNEIDKEYCEVIIKLVPREDIRKVGF